MSKRYFLGVDPGQKNNAFAFYNGVDYATFVTSNSRKISKILNRFEPQGAIIEGDPRDPLAGVIGPIVVQWQQLLTERGINTEILLPGFWRKYYNINKSPFSHEVVSGLRERSINVKKQARLVSGKFFPNLNHSECKADEVEALLMAKLARDRYLNLID